MEAAVFGGVGRLVVHGLYTWERVWASVCLLIKALDNAASAARAHLCWEPVMARVGVLSAVGGTVSVQLNGIIISLS